ncbi:MAG: NUDIX hydrolase [Vicinamibacterales bacterium]
MTRDRDDLTSIEGFLRDRLARPLPGGDAQFRFSPLPTRKGWRPEMQPPEARRAAALLLLYPDHDGVRFALTVRRHDLPQHAGQVSLPGGRIDAGETPLDAALREAQEEIGVPPESVRILGPLSSLWVVVSNHLLFPFVGLADARPDFRPAPEEVARILEVSLDDLRDPASLGWSRHAREGIVVDYPHFVFGGHQTWGATAMVLGEFGSLFDPNFRPPPR